MSLRRDKVIQGLSEGLRFHLEHFGAKGGWDVDRAQKTIAELRSLLESDSRPGLMAPLDAMAKLLKGATTKKKQNATRRDKLFRLMAEFEEKLAQDPPPVEEATPEPAPEPAAEENAEPSLEEILRAAFLEESAAALPALSDGLEEFAKLSDPQERATRMQPVFRAAHSIKGAARAIELHEAEMLAAALEEKLRAGSKPESCHYSDEHLQILRDGIALLGKVEQSYRNETRPPSGKKLQKMVEQLDQVVALEPPAQVEPEPEPEPEPVAEEQPEEESPAVAAEQAVVEELDELEALLRETFTAEAKQQLPLMRQGVSNFPLDRQPNPEEAAKTLSRAAHTLRGSARAVDFPEMEALCGVLEERLRDLERQRAYGLSGQPLELLRKGVLLAERLARAFEGKSSMPDGNTLQSTIEALEGLEIEAAAPPAPRPEPVSAEPEPEPESEPETVAEQIDEPEPGPEEPDAADSEELQALLESSFRTEASTFNQEFFDGLEAYKAADDPASRARALEPVFRAVHGLRGAARAVDLTEAEILSSTLEQKLRAATQPHRSYLSRTDLSALETAGATLKTCIDSFLDKSRPPSRNRVRQVLEALERVDPGAPEQSIEMPIQIPEPEAEPSEPPSIERLFSEEAEDYILSINQQLVQLERKAHSEEAAGLLEQVFRDVHSLKGAARSVGLDQVESVCQGLETIYSRVKRNEIELDQQALDVSFRCMDVVSKLLDRQTVASSELNQLDLEMDSIAQGRDLAAAQSGRRKAPRKATPGPAPVAAVPTPPERETVRLATNKLDGLLLQAEEMLAIKLKSLQRTNEVREMESYLDQWDRQWKKVAPALAALKDISDSQPVVDFLLWNQRYIRSLESQVDALYRRSVQDDRTTRGLVDNLLQDAKQLLLFPFSSLLDRFPRLIRDLGRDLNKDVLFQIRGQEIEIDRRILDELRDPLTHLTRNAVDHGLETTAERRRAGKSAQGMLAINISRETAEHILVEVRDDGRGIDPTKLRRKAVEKGIHTEESAARLSDQEAVDLIFLSDFSTSESVSEVSGRGLGMPIVADKIKALGGTVAARSVVGEGTRFLLRLPIRRATYNGILVSAGDQVVVIPTASVVSVHRFDFEKEIQTVEGQATVEVQGRIVPVRRLEQVLGFTRTDQASVSPFVLAVLLEYREEQAAFIVDELLAEQEILAKKPSFPLDQIPTLAGSTILGNGKVAPIINVAALVEPLKKTRKKVDRQAVAPVRPKAEQYKILLCDDSITSRTLLTHMLSNAGYQVTAEIDGARAYDELLKGDYDLLCSDVEMPNMTGLELCAKVRQTPGFEDIPIILITTLDDPDDHQRGADAGASAYVVKGRLDQSHLLETVEFLI